VSQRETRVDSQGITRRIRHRTYRNIASAKWYVQTYRVHVKLDCGHVTSFTRPGRDRDEQLPKRLDCGRCAEGREGARDER
jgi:hypothetical protein